MDGSRLEADLFCTRPPASNSSGGAVVVHYVIEDMNTSGYFSMHFVPKEHTLDNGNREQRASAAAHDIKN